MRRITLAAFLLLAAAAIAGVARPDGASAGDPVAAPMDSVTVAGTGSVSSVPTKAALSFGVETRADSAVAALSANARAMRKVIDAVKAAGGRDVGTQAVSLSPVVGQDGKLEGYVAVNAVSATVGVDRAGGVIDAAVGAGANQVNGPSLSVADRGALYRQALKAAVADARLSAETIAVAAGRSLGKVTSVVEGGGPVTLPMFEKAAISDEGTPIEAGTQLTTATVSVTFALA